MNDERIKYVDFAAGIMILWVIIYHALMVSFQTHLFLGYDMSGVDVFPFSTMDRLRLHSNDGYPSPFVVFPYLYFLIPWFFYKSGMLFKKRPFVKILSSDSKKFLIPFVIWSFAGYILWLIFCAAEHTLTLRTATYSVLRELFLEGRVQLNTPCWFIIPLFIAREVCNLLLPEREDAHFHLKCILITLLGTIIAYSAHALKWRLLPMWVADGAAAVSFLTLGYWLRDYESKIWLIALCLVGYIANCVWGGAIVSTFHNEAIVGNYYLYIPTCLFGIVVFNNLCKWISVHTGLVTRPIEMLGMYSMPIYLVHGLIYESVQRILVLNGYSQVMPYIFWIIIASYLIILPIAVLCWKRLHNK